MEDALGPIVEMNESIWKGFRGDLADVTAEEVDWRPLPQANTINLIVRHLRIEAAWHLASLEHGAPMPSETTPDLLQEIDAVPLEFDRNLKELEDLYTRYLAALGRTTPAGLKQQTALAYGAFPSREPAPAHFLGFHQAMHLAMHWGQLRTIRNLYCKTHGEPARFFPDNPSYPKE